MTTTRRDFIKQALTTALAFAAGLFINAVKPEREVRKVPVVKPLKDAYAQAVLATGPVVYPRRWAHLEDLQVVMPLRVAREE